MLGVSRVLARIAPLAVLALAPAVARADGDGSSTAAPSEIAPAPRALNITTSGAPEVDVEDGHRPPVGYAEVHRKRSGLLVCGAISFVASYSISAIIALDGEGLSGVTGGRNGVAAMWIPVAGPFTQLSQDNTATENGILVGLGAAQLVGVVMMYLGDTTTRRAWVRNDLVSNVAVTPMAGPNGATGLALSGQW